MLVVETCMYHAADACRRYLRGNCGGPVPIAPYHILPRRNLCNHSKLFGWTTETQVQSNVHCLILCFAEVSAFCWLEKLGSRFGRPWALQQCISKTDHVMDRQPQPSHELHSLLDAIVKRVQCACFSLIRHPWEDWPTAPTMGPILFHKSLLTFSISGTDVPRMQTKMQWGWDYWMRVTTLAPSVSRCF